MQNSNQSEPKIARNAAKNISFYTMVAPGKKNLER
jgi:hypothetical protein